MEYIYPIRVTHHQGGMLQTQLTGEYPDYYTLYSVKHKQTWTFKKLPIFLKLKGQKVLYVEGNGEDIKVFDMEKNELPFLMIHILSD